MLTSCNYFVDYVDAILLDERYALTVDVIYEFVEQFFPKVCLFIVAVVFILVLCYYNCRYPLKFSMIKR